MTINTNDFHYLCEVGDLAPNTPQTFEVEDRFVVAVAIDGTIHCIEDLCTHDGGALGGGELEGYCLVCPRHGAKFDVRTGKVMCMPATEDTPSHEIRVDGTRVLVRLRD